MLLDKIKAGTENYPLSELASELNKRIDDTLKDLEAMAEVANRAYNDYTNTVPSSDYELSSDYYDRFTSMWDLRDELLGEIDELKNFDAEEYVDELRKSA